MAYLYSMWSVSPQQAIPGLCIRGALQVPRVRSTQKPLEVRLRICIFALQLIFWVKSNHMSCPDWRSTERDSISWMKEKLCGHFCHYSTFFPETLTNNGITTRLKIIGNLWHTFSPWIFLSSEFLPCFSSHLFSVHSVTQSDSLRNF